MADPEPTEQTIRVQILFLALCAVLANIVVVVIAIIRAYREEKRARRFSGFAPG